MFTPTPQNVFYTKPSLPQTIVIWQDENCGIAALLNAAQDILAGKTVVFVLCERAQVLPPRPVDRMAFALSQWEGHACVRLCGENNAPNGSGSSTLLSHDYPYALDAGAIAVALALAFKRYDLYFRLHNL